MFPMVGKLRIFANDRKKIGLWLPLFLVWPVLIILMLILLPLVILIKLIKMLMKQDSRIHIAGPMFFYLAWHMRGLMIDVKSKSGDKVYINFK